MNEQLMFAQFMDAVIMFTYPGVITNRVPLLQLNRIVFMYMQIAGALTTLRKLKGESLYYL